MRRRTPHDAVSPPVSRWRLVVYGALLGLLGALARFLGAPDEIVWTLALCAVVYAVVAMLPDRIRRLLAWDLNNW